ncbi:MAG: class I SAM-dependent methyltransferase [Thermoanaerobaculia bacterium]
MAAGDGGAASIYDPAAYGDGCAPYYDQLYPNVPGGVVGALAALAGGGRALELGLATGRVAVPLRARGVVVHGVDASLLMLSRFRARPLTAPVHAAAGDISALPYERAFRLVFALVGTLGLLPSAGLQLRCLREVVRVLEPGGAFLCETFDEGAEARPATHSYPVLTPGGPVRYGVTFLPTPSRILDELADAAGLALSSRWGSWARAPFVPGRSHCISVYRTPVASP